MVAKRTAAQEAATKALEAPTGGLSGRLRELFAKTVVPQPYAVTDDIIITPPTKAAWDELDRLQAKKSGYQVLLANSWGRVGTDGGPSREDIEELTAAVNDAEDDYSRLFFGERVDDLMALSASWQREQWNAFVTEIRAQFLGQKLDDGKCPTCGHVDEEEAGKPPSSST